jgi:hypothetical protein
MTPIQVVSNYEVDCKRLRHIRVGPDDLKSSSGVAFEPDFHLLVALDTIIDAALQAWTSVKLQSKEGRDTEMFMSRWKKLVEVDPRSAVEALVHSVFAAKKALMQPSVRIVLDDSTYVLFDVMKAKNDKNEATSTSQWPLMSHIVPELSHWVLAIHAPNSHHSLRMLITELLQSTFSSPYAMLALHGQLCEGIVAKVDASRPTLFIGDRFLRIQHATYGALRVLGLSTFVSKFWESVVSQSVKACSSCQTLRTPEFLKRCARCHCACYCSRECQKQHFCRQHRVECNEYKQLYERYDGNSSIKMAGKRKAQLLICLENFVCPKLIQESRVMFTFKASLRDDIIHNKGHTSVRD